MSPLTAKPVLHGRDHLPGGADPIPGIGTGFTTYAEMIQASGPWAYWPLDDTSGNFAELTAGRDMAAAEYTGPDPPMTLTYGLPGPFTDDAGTSVGFTGLDNLGAGSGLEGTRGYYDLTSGERDTVFGSVGDGSFTVELWFYPASPIVVDNLGTANYRGVIFGLGDALGPVWTIYLKSDGTLHLYRDTFNLVTGATTGFELTASPTIPNNWNHLAFSSCHSSSASPLFA